MRPRSSTVCVSCSNAVLGRSATTWGASGAGFDSPTSLTAGTVGVYAVSPPSTVATVNVRTAKDHTVAQRVISVPVKLQVEIQNVDNRCHRLSWIMSKDGTILWRIHEPSGTTVSSPARLAGPTSEDELQPRLQRVVLLEEPLRPGPESDRPTKPGVFPVELRSHPFV